MRLSPPAPLDPRVARTRQLLVDALAALLRDRPYPQVTVKDVAATATVNRATFYAHFADKDDLFRSLLQSEIDQALDERLGGGEAPSTLGAYLDALLPAAFAFADWTAGRCRTARHGADAPHPAEELQSGLEAHVAAWLAAHRPGVPSEFAARAVSAMAARVATHWSRQLERQPADQVMGPLRAMIVAAVGALETSGAPA